MNDPRLELVTLTGVDGEPRPLARDGLLLDARRDDAAPGTTGRRGVRRRRGRRAARTPRPHLRGVLGRQMRIAPGAAPHVRGRPRHRVRAAHRGDPARHPPRRRRERRGWWRGRTAGGIVSSGRPRGRRRHSARAAEVIVAAPRGRARVPRQSRRRRARLDARRCTTCCAAAGIDERRVVLGAVRRRAALPRAARPRPADAARPVPARARGDGHVRLGLARAPRRSRAGRPRPPTSSIVVDHHVSNQRYGTINVIDPDAAASGVLVRRLIDELDLPLDARRRGLPLRRARVRHRPLPVRVDDRRGVRARARAR